MCAAFDGHKAGLKTMPFKEKLHQSKKSFYPCFYKYAKLQVIAVSSAVRPDCPTRNQFTKTKVRRVDRLALNPTRDFATRTVSVIQRLDRFSRAASFFLHNQSLSRYKFNSGNLFARARADRRFF
jgi:hypothetical protein